MRFVPAASIAALVLAWAPGVVLYVGGVVPHRSQTADFRLSFTESVAAVSPLAECIPSHAEFSPWSHKAADAQIHLSRCWEPA